MRQFYFIVLLALCLGCAVMEARGQSDVGAELTPKLQLTSEVAEGRFCESGYLRLKLRLRYLSTGNQPLILYRQSNTIMTYFISKNIRDAERDKYEQKYSPLQRRVGPPEVLDGERPDEQKFVILAPGDSYEVTSQAHFPFIFDGKDPDPVLLRPGRHVLEIRVETWPVAQDAAVELRDRWRTHGFLWTKSVISLPMTFDVAKQPQIVGCSNWID